MKVNPIQTLYLPTSSAFSSKRHISRVSRAKDAYHVAGKTSILVNCALIRQWFKVYLDRKVYRDVLDDSWTIRYSWLRFSHERIACFLSHIRFVVSLPLLNIRGAVSRIAKLAIHSGTSVKLFPMLCHHCAPSARAWFWSSTVRVSAVPLRWQAWQA